MNLEQAPSKSEVLGWSPQQLADYLRMCNLAGCDKVVLKNSIRGSRFLDLSENDLQKFPKVHMPMISKISKEISKEKRKTRLPPWKPNPKYPEPEMLVDNQGWGEEEFDEFDDDYENPDSGDDEDSGGDYESPNDDPDCEDAYEPPPSEPPEDLKPCLPLLVGDGDYIDNRNNPPPILNPRPQIAAPPRVELRGDPSPQAARKFPHEPPKIERYKKPQRPAAHSPTPGGGIHGSSAEPPSTPSWKPPVPAPDLSSRPRPPGPLPPSASVNRSNSSARPPSSRFEDRREQAHDEGQRHNTFPLHNKSARAGLPPQRFGDSLPPSVSPGGSLPHKPNLAKPESRGSVMNRSSFRPPLLKGLDPRWYVGQVTRGEAEGCLARVKKDGAYLVRDSTRQLDSQPYTLMVLYQDKVYNIQIRQQNQQFLLGTGLKVQELFPSVAEIIGHYSKSPLLLIDSKNRSSSQQNQCLLSDPAGHYMTRQKWS